VVPQLRGQARTGNPDVECLRADPSAQRQVRELARPFRERHLRLDVLVNNAGGLWLRRERTEDGRERTFAVNHLAYFLLTHLLLDRLQESAPALVVNVASAAHRQAGLDFGDLLGERGYDGWRAYCRSKLCNLLFTYELAQRLAGGGVTANALHPGWVATAFAGHNGRRGRLWQLAARLFAVSPERGARTIVSLATAPEQAGVTGRYFAREQAAASSPASSDEAAARRLWQVSAELAHLPARAS
jgi:NAD(P)-dependent dehydrogenase (short-subunit alcohol dehydrogenase family)